MKGFIFIIIAIIFCSCVERPRQRTSERSGQEDQQGGKYIVNVVDDSFRVIKSFKSKWRPEMIKGGAFKYRGEDGRDHILVNVKAEIIR